MRLHHSSVQLLHLLRREFHGYKFPPSVDGGSGSLLLLGKPAVKLEKGFEIDSVSRNFLRLFPGSFLAG